MQVLPAAQPSFLQEVAVLDHREANAPATSAATASNGNGKAKSSKSRKKHRRSSSSASSASSSSSSTTTARPARPLPTESLVVLGQTSKKFLVVPDINDLLAGVALQEKRERDDERRVKMERARGAATQAGLGGATGAAAAGGKGKGRR